MSIQFCTISQISSLLKNKKISKKEVIEETKKLAAAYNPSLNAIIELYEDSKTEKINETSLDAIPFFIKDNLLYKGKIASAGSKILSTMVAPYTGTVVQRLLDAGGLCMGRANCDEFAMGSSGETSWYGPTKNPWDLSKVPGGSSSGSAAVVAAGIVPFALGSETGGSVRQPAVLCGLTGLKPTYGLHSRYGLIAYASSLDQIGIFTRTAEDAAIVLSKTAGTDSYDSTTTQSISSFDYTKNLAHSIRGKKIGIIKNALYQSGMNPAVQKNLQDAIAVFQSLGAECGEIEIDTMQYSAALYFVISRAEAASNLSRFDGVRYGKRSEKYEDLLSMYGNTRSEGFGYTVKRRIILGNYVLTSEHADQYYKKAKEIQQAMKEEFNKAFSQYDMLFSPVTPEPAFGLGEMINNPLAIDLQDYFTAAANLVGIPALSLQSGFIDGLPIGFQLMANEFQEELLLQAGFQYQQVTDWHTKCPVL